MKHVAAAPKGILRYYVLSLLGEKPMSGSEIMSEIENRSHSRWKPSPGSIYPLLAWLQEKGYTQEAAEQEPGIKRYILTDQGKSFLEECAKRKQELRSRIGFFTPPFFGPHWSRRYPEETRDIIEAGRKLIMSSWGLMDLLREGHSEETIKEATEILEEATKKIEGLAEKLKK